MYSIPQIFFWELFMDIYSLEYIEGNSDLRVEGKSMTVLSLLLKCKLGLRLGGSEPSVAINGSAFHAQMPLCKKSFSFLWSLRAVVALDSFRISQKYPSGKGRCANSVLQAKASTDQVVFPLGPFRPSQLCPQSQYHLASLLNVCDTEQYRKSLIPLSVTKELGMSPSRDINP